MILGAYAWDFFNDGANKHTPIITYHQIDDTNQSIRVKFCYYSAIYFCAKKKEEISKEREKNTSCFMKKKRFPHQSICSKRKLEKKVRKKRKETFLELQRIPTYTIHFQQCVSFPKNILLLSSNKAWCSG